MSGEDFLGRMERERLEVENCAENTRIYDYLVGRLNSITSRKGVKKALSRNQVRLNNSLAKSGDFIKKGDLIIVYENEFAQHKDFDIDLENIFEDEELAVLVKPPGILVSGNTFKTFQNALTNHLTKSTASDYLPQALPVHRLDQLTHGLIIVAKTHSSRVKLGEMFENKSIRKIYHAIVQGKLKGEGSLNSSVDGKAALTHFEALDCFPSVKNEWISLIKLNPITGRKHQLRVHLSRLGFPIIGDPIYGEKGNTLQHKGLFLSATGLEFPHPKTKENLCLKIELPNKFQRFLAREERWFNRVKS